MPRKIVLVMVEDGSVTDTVAVNDPDLEVTVIDWDELEVDTLAARDLLDEIQDLGVNEGKTGTKEALEAIRERLNKIIEDDDDDSGDADDDELEETCCPDCGDPDCIGDCLNGDADDV
jgi:hypothetical protein